MRADAGANPEGEVMGYLANLVANLPADKDIDVCGATGPSQLFVCSEPVGHTGPHIARVGREPKDIMELWQQHGRNLRWTLPVGGPS